MGNREDEEPLEAEIPRIPRVERNKNIKIPDMQFTEVCVLLASKIVELVDNIELNCWMKKEKERATPIVAFEKMQIRFQFKNVETVGMVKLERHVLNGQIPHPTPLLLL